MKQIFLNHEALGVVSSVGYYLASDVDARIAELEKALQPFANAVRGAEHMQELATAARNNPVDGTCAYVWWASRSLSVHHFKQAFSALMEREAT